VYSLNVPLPEAVRERTATLRPALTDFEAVRESRTQTLVLKRLPAEDRREYLTAERRARAALACAPAVEAEVTGIDAFWDPPNGTGPVVFLAVTSPGLLDLHRRLVAEFGAIDELEGDSYVPHITLARGGERRAVSRLQQRSFEPIRFRIVTLEFYDGTDGERIDTLSLPA
jgi:2'-5' RNA ligase